MIRAARHAVGVFVPGTGHGGSVRSPAVPPTVPPTVPQPDPAPPTVLPYGSWPTPITSELIVRAAAGLSEVQVDGDDVWWSEQRPEEGGRTQLVRLAPGAGPVDVLPEGWNARTTAHEYGGGSWWVRDGRLWFANWADQRLYRLDPGGVPGRDRRAHGEEGGAVGRRRCLARRPLAALRA